jgi:hypothetical protein
MRRTLVPAALVLIAACYTPPHAPTPREAAPVAASAGRTWDAVIATLGDRNIPIASMERASGFIASPTLTLETVRTRPKGLADCGRSFFSGAPEPTAATYNVLVRGDSSASTIKVTASYVSTTTDSNGTQSVNCASTARFETEVEQAVRARAESR